MIRVAIANRQTTCPIDRARLRLAVRRVLQGEQIASATISLAIVDDPTIHALNRQYLQHDYATDVLSFVFERDEAEASVDGEVIVSMDTAQRVAAERGLTADEEVLLYAIHGTLHLVGYDDLRAPDRQKMRRRERHYLAELAATPRPSRQ